MNVIVHCEICNKSILVVPSIASRKRFCSRQCTRKWQSKRMAGINNPAYKGGTQIYTNGKQRIKSQSFEYVLGSAKKKALHRYIVEKAIGRKLKSTEHVHHIDGNSLNNNPNNLLVCTIGFHRYLHEKMSRLYMKEHFANAS